MKLQIHIDVDDRKAQKLLTDMQARSKNMKPVLWEAQKKLEMANAENFATGGLPVGGWAPRAGVNPWPLMMRTGNLMESLTNLVGPPNEINATSATFGTDVEYATFHQKGTSRMPARQIVFEPHGFAHDVGQDAADYIVGFFKR